MILMCAHMLVNEFLCAIRTPTGGGRPLPKEACFFLPRAHVLMAFVGEVLCAIGLTTEWLALSFHTDVFYIAGPCAYASVGGILCTIGLTTAAPRIVL